MASFPIHIKLPRILYPVIIIIGRHTRTLCNWFHWVYDIVIISPHPLNSRHWGRDLQHTVVEGGIGLRTFQPENHRCSTSVLLLVCDYESPHHTTAGEWRRYSVCCQSTIQLILMIRTPVVGLHNNMWLTSDEFYTASSQQSGFLRDTHCLRFNSNDRRFIHQWSPTTVCILADK